MANMTKAELQEVLDQQKEQLKELRRENQSLLDQKTQLRKRDEGWLITAPNELFNGQIYGVRFSDGLAFVSVLDKPARFANQKKTSEATIRRYVDGQYPSPTYDDEFRAEKTEEIKLMEERVKPAQTAVLRIASDFGYEVKFFDTSDQAQQLLQAKIAERRGRADQQMQQEEVIRPDLREILAPSFSGE